MTADITQKCKVQNVIPRSDAPDGRGNTEEIHRCVDSISYLFDKYYDVTVQCRQFPHSNALSLTWEYHGDQVDTTRDELIEKFTAVVISYEKNINNI